MDFTKPTEVRHYFAELHSLLVQNAGDGKDVHELSNILASIQGILQLIEKEGAKEHLKDRFEAELVKLRKLIFAQQKGTYRRGRFDDKIAE